MQLNSICAIPPWCEPDFNRYFPIAELCPFDCKWDGVIRVTEVTRHFPFSFLSVLPDILSLPVTPIPEEEQTKQIDFVVSQTISLEMNSLFMQSFLNR